MLPRGNLRDLGTIVSFLKRSRDCLLLSHWVWLEQDSVHAIDLKADQIQTFLLYSSLVLTQKSIIRQ